MGMDAYILSQFTITALTTEQKFSSTQCLLKLDYSKTELQIREGIEDNSEIIFLISQRKHVVTPHYNRLIETVLMMGNNKCFYGEI